MSVCMEETHSQPFTQVQIGYLVQLARWEMARLFGKWLDSPTCERRVWGPGFVNITLHRDGLLCGSMGARSAHLPDAVREATRKACLDDRFGRTVTVGDYDSTVIELGIELECVPLSVDRYRLVSELQLGRDGVSITLGRAHAYYKPSVAITHSIPTAYELLGRLCQKAGIVETAWLDPAAHVERSRWISVLENSQARSGFTSLYKVRCLTYQSIDVAQIRAAVKLSIERLCAVQRADGALGYLYDPFKDKWLGGANRVRQAGSAYALARAADHPMAAGNGGLKSAASRALRFLMERTAMASSATALVVREEESGGPWGRLGTVALTSLTALHSVGEEWKAESLGLLEQLFRAQNADGSFECFIGREATLKEKEGAQDYAPGESLLSLVEYTHRTGDLRGYAAAGKAFPYYQEHFRSRPATAFVAWQADVWSRIALRLLKSPSAHVAELIPDTNQIREFVFGQVDWLLTFQYTRNHDCATEYLGGFKVPYPPSFSTSAYLEPLIRACDLANEIGDHSRTERYREAALAAIGFLMRLQVRPETAALFPRPKLAVGALTSTLEIFQMRCDYDQHFITSCLTAIDSTGLWSSPP